MLCKIKNCGNDATDYIHVTVPNTPTENYDAINPLRVDICAYHRRLIQKQEFLPFEALSAITMAGDPPAPSKETHG